MIEFYYPLKERGICTIEKITRLNCASFEITGKDCKTGKTRTVVI